MDELIACSDGGTVEVVGDANLGVERQPTAYLLPQHDHIAQSVTIVGRHREVVAQTAFITIDTAVVVVGMKPGYAASEACRRPRIP